eukprot:239392-Rhodomonas_salina.1
MEHVDRPMPGAYSPRLHGTHSSAPFELEMRPGGHGGQAAAPEFGWKNPSSHSEQEGDPGNGENRHDAHSSPKNGCEFPVKYVPGVQSLACADNKQLPRQRTKRQAGGKDQAITPATRCPGAVVERLDEWDCIIPFILFIMFSKVLKMYAVQPRIPVFPRFDPSPAVGAVPKVR